jgi:hypothetical protein
VAALRHSAVIIGSALIAFWVAHAGAGADLNQWVWSKSWTESQLQKHFPGATTSCSPVGPPTHEAGYNVYAEFACSIGLPRGAGYVLVIKPRSKAAWNVLSIEKTALPSTSIAAPQADARVGGAYSGTTSTHRITAKSLDGSLITLADGSKWLVTPVDRYATVLWLVKDAVTVVRGSDKGYPYQLLDTRAGTSASARFLGQ